MTRGRLLRFGRLSLCASAGLLGCSGDNLILPGEGAPIAISIVSGDGQADTVGRPLPGLLVVRIIDSKNRPVQSQAVSFTPQVNGTGARLIPDTAVTDADGQAQTRWELATGQGTQTVRAKVLGGTAAEQVYVDLSASAAPDAPSTLMLLSGDAQNGTVGSQLAQALTVVATDRFGNGIDGVVITWKALGGGAVSATSTGTGADGQTSVRRTLGPIAGSQSTTATAPGLSGSPLSFSHVATQGQPVALRMDSGDGQSELAGATLPRALVVRLVDAAGNGVPGPAVAWAVATGGGSVVPAGGTIGADGRAAATLTLGPVAGPNTVFASAAGFSVLFSATGTATPQARIVANSATTLSGPAGSPAIPRPSVKVTDAGNNPLQGVAVTFTVTGGGGSVIPASASTDAAGIASVTSWTLGAAAGNNTLSASASASGHPLAGSPVVFTAIGSVVTGPPATVVITTQPSPAVPNTATLPSQPEVLVQDGSGGPVDGVAVTVAIASGGGVLSGSTTVLTDPTGTAAFAGLSLTGTVGVRTLRFSAGAVSATSSAITVTAGPASAAHSSANVPNGTAGVPTALTVQARDVSDNLTAGGASVAIGVSGANTATPPVTDQHNGSYTASYTPTSGGIDVVAITLAGAAISGSPYLSAVQSGPVSASQSTLQVSPTSITASTGSSGATVSVTAVDASGNPIAGANVSFAATGANNSFTPATAITDASGHATTTFSSTASGTRTIAATAGGVTLTQTRTLNVDPGAADPSQTTASVPGGRSRQPTIITVQTLDRFGNALTTGGHVVVIDVTGTNNAGPITANDNGDGSYTASYTPSRRGNDDIAITLDGAPISGSPYRSKVR
ncbi:MAG: Ig-like domain-containing protein [Gemmatimonadota bacterium]